jgi:hypothetical protein
MRLDRRMPEILDQRSRARQHQFNIVDDQDPHDRGAAGGCFERSTLRVAAAGMVFARSSHNCTLVPTPGALSMRSNPPDCAAKPWTMDNPRPAA